MLFHVTDIVHPYQNKPILCLYFPKQILLQRIKCTSLLCFKNNVKQKITVIALGFRACIESIFNILPNLHFDRPYH